MYVTALQESKQVGPHSDVVFSAAGPYSPALDGHHNLQ